MRVSSKDFCLSCLIYFNTIIQISFIYTSMWDMDGSYLLIFLSILVHFPCFMPISFRQLFWIKCYKLQGSGQWVCIVKQNVGSDLQFRSIWLFHLLQLPPRPELVSTYVRSVRKLYQTNSTTYIVLLLEFNLLPPR